MTLVYCAKRHVNFEQPPTVKEDHKFQSVFHLLNNYLQFKQTSCAYS